MRGALRLVAAALCAALALPLIAGCGGDNKEPRPSGADRPVRGGTLTLLSNSDVDFLDPGRTYHATGYQVAYATQRPLYGFRPDDAAHIVPDLAAGPPRISADGRTVTVRIRSGVRFSPPVNREVAADDVAYALERAFSENVANPYTSYFSDLVGAPAAPSKGAPRRIRGIETPDRRTIVFHLRRPTAGLFAAALVSPAAAPVPREYARRFDAASPSTYNTHIVATGPYMVRNDASGRTVGFQPGRRIELVRNPNWRSGTDARPAYLDRVVIETNATDQAIAARQVIAGSHRLLASNPPPSALRRLRGTGQSVTIPVGGFRYLPINTKLAPFDDVNVRRAIQAAFNREAARKLRGGPATGEYATHYLPPGMPGFEQAGGQAGPGFDFLDPKRPRGDLDLAQRYMRRAGYASGRYEGNQTFLMVGPVSEPDRGVAEVAKAQLERLGFKIRLRLLAYDVALADWCQVPARKVAICGGLTWSRDVPDPGPMLEPAFGGFAISKSANPNMPQLDDPAIDRAMRRAETLRGAARLRAWGEIDRMITAQAPSILLQWDRATLVRSRDVVGVPNTYFVGWDLAYTGLR